MKLRGRLISLGDKTGNFVRPWAEAGYECWCVDIQHSIRRERVDGNTHYVWGDIRSWAPPESPLRTAFVAVWSPCTNLTVAGARDFVTKGLPMLWDGLWLFNDGIKSARWSGAPYLAENPVGVISSHFRKPDYTFSPYEYAGYLDDPAPEAYTKKTCLWTGGGFVMPPTKPVPPTLGSKMHKLPPSKDRADLRSATPLGFAEAVYLANAPHLKSEAA